jgi:hypothetical protein
LGFDDVLTGAAPAVPAPRDEATAGQLSAAPTPGVYTAPPKARAGGLVGSDFVKGAVFGAVVALLGVLVGAWVG